MLNVDQTLKKCYRLVLMYCDPPKISIRVKLHCFYLFIKPIMHQRSKLNELLSLQESKTVISPSQLGVKGQVQRVSFYVCICVCVQERDLWVTAQVSFPDSPCSLASTQCVKWPLRGGPVTLMRLYTADAHSHTRAPSHAHERVRRGKTCKRINTTTIYMCSADACWDWTY